MTLRCAGCTQPATTRCDFVYPEDRIFCGAPVCDDCTHRAGGSHRPDDAEENDRPVKVTVRITGRNGETTTYALDAATVHEERTKVHGHPLDVRFTLSDVEYLS